MTLSELYEDFKRDARWGRLATQSARAMVAVLLQTLGQADTATLSTDALQTCLTNYRDAELRVKAQACMHYMQQWASGRGITLPAIPHPAMSYAPSTTPVPREDRPRFGSVYPHKMRGNHIYWCADVTIRGNRYTHHSKSRTECVRWLNDLWRDNAAEPK